MTGTVDRALRNAQLIILMLAAVIVPIVVLPESHFVDITSTPKTTILRMLGTLQFGVLVSRLVLSLSVTNDHRLTDSLRTIRESRSTFAILISMTVVGFVSLISASISILPHQSWWGRNPAGFESGEFTGLMYMVLAASAFISVREMRSSQKIWQTLAITGAIASLIGFFQFLGWSPLDISSTHNIRLTGTNGNPIFFGAMLLVLAPITIGVLLQRHQDASINYKRWWLAAIALATFLIVVSLLGTVSRGTWVGGFAGGVIAIAFIATYGRSRIHLLPTATVVLFAIIGTLVMTFVDPTPVELPEGVTADPNAETSAVTSAFDSATKSSTLDLRLRYWRMSASMATDREPVPYTNDAPKFIRFLFGYGPDMFRYSGTYFSDNTTFTRRLTAAHNDPINRLVEQGLLGLVAWLTLWASIAFGGLSLIRRFGRLQSNALGWIAIGVTAGLAGRFVEQLFGSPTPGGVLVFWITTGALAGMLLNSQPASEPNQSVIKSAAPNINPAAKQFVGYALILVVLVSSIVLAWDKGANYLIANQIAAFRNREHTNAFTYTDAIEKLETAARLAPDVARYWHDLAVIEQERAAATQDPNIKSKALYQAYQYDLKAYETNPMEVGSIYNLAFSAWETSGAGQPQLRQDVIGLYERLNMIIPSDELAKERLQTLKEFLEQ